jgi:hypothetical protein
LVIVWTSKPERGFTYDFAPEAPTPEPASLLLVGAGAVGLVARRRARRNLEG